MHIVIVCVFVVIRAFAAHTQLSLAFLHNEMQKEMQHSALFVLCIVGAYGIRPIMNGHCYC